MKKEAPSIRAVNVCIAGYFDPIHEGHLSHILEAKKLGNKLTAIVGTEDQCRRKHGSIFLTWEGKVALLKALGVDEVIPNIDNEDGKPCVETLKKLRPNIFAKGESEIIPVSEMEVCREIGCKIIFGVGKRLNRSSKYFVSKETTNELEK